jgi:Xaa-Pro aminopeptidase
MDVNQRLTKLRELMQRERLGAFIFPSTDPHNSEYVADHWKCREWISGFNGSAGTAVVTMTSAALWTDSRYFIAAAEQLKGTEFQLMKDGVAGTPTIAQWLGQQLQTTTNSTQRADSTEVAIDGSVVSAAAAERLVTDLRREGGLTLRTNLDAMRQIWTGRPAIPTNPVELQPLEYAGKSAHEKLDDIRKALRQEHADGMLVAALDDIAWALNLRGSDVHCNPVFVSYLLIDTKKATLFIDQKKLSPAIVKYLRREGVPVDDYDNVVQGLKDYFEYNILIDPDEVNYTLYKKVEREIVRRPSPLPFLKAVKTEAEIAGFHRAMIRDGVAMVKFLKWLEEECENTGASSLSETSVSEKLESLRAGQPLYRGISFDTIAGYQEHGAIVHYEATPETDAPLKPEGLLLLDSGAQYQDGTTDITRTIALGPVTEEQRHVYTLVLKGHIQLAMLCFPEGASGTQLDALARKDMWAEGMNFLHGTGHGVGSYLCVHEGPQQIRMEYRAARFHAGMTITDEPGIYLAGRFGVRIENMLIAVPHVTTDFGSFLKFETLTLCPIDKVPIDMTMLTADERQWLDNYHEHVYAMLSPHLDDDEKQWLQKATQPLTTK